MADKGGASICPYCGQGEDAHQHHPLYLKPHTLLQNQYVTGRVLGQGGFGITYLGLDLRLRKSVAIKEYLPSTLATRDPLMAGVLPLRNQEASFAKGLELFLREARHLARFRHPHIVRVLNYFEANHTGYMVMEYLEGVSPAALLKPNGGRLPPARALRLLLPILDALREVHAQQFYHLDISAQNVRLDHHDEPILIDFGAARQIIGDYTHSLALVLRPGYSPLEQYMEKGRIGAWTDVYACGALLYVLITGKLPPPAPERIEEDRLQWPSQLGVKISPELEAALAAALEVRVEERLPDVETLQHRLWQTPEYLGLSSRDSPFSRASAPFSRWRLILGAGLLSLVLISGLVIRHEWETRPDSIQLSPPDSAPEPLPEWPGLARHWLQTTRGILDTGTHKLRNNMRELLASLPRPEPDQAARQRVESLLEQAGRQLAELKLTTPEGDNAYQTYQRILRDYPGHPRALAGLRRIADRYAELAARETEQPGQQRQLLRKGLRVMPEHPRLLGLLQNLDSAPPSPSDPPETPPEAEPEIGESEKPAVPDPAELEIQNWLEQARGLSQLGQWRESAALYHRVLARLPESPEANSGLANIIEHYVELARRQQQAGEHAAALETVTRGLSIDPEAPRLLALRQSLQAEKADSSPSPPVAPGEEARENNDSVLFTPSF